MPINIIIFELNKNLRHEIIRLLSAEASFALIGKIEDPDHYISNLRSKEPDIIILDLTSSTSTICHMINLLNQRMPNAKILIQSASHIESDIKKVIQAGAVGYILKHELRTYLVKAINDIFNGGAFMSPLITRKVLNLLQKETCQPLKYINTTDYKLTKKEQQIVGCFAQGQGYESTCFTLNIQYNTARKHISNIYKKMNVGSLTELVSKVHRENLHYS
ncbi:MAG: response regulator transcription factor [Mucilaginibacter sp.]|uniref:response regulator transcription factor n=1 Tax=Mucilaginibacter sp. TaxID=1882438 RepID=UPI0031A7C8F8